MKQIVMTFNLIYKDLKAINHNFLEILSSEIYLPKNYIFSMGKSSETYMHIY